MPVISSRANPLVKFYRQKIRGFPGKTPETVIEGTRLIEEAIHSGAVFEIVFCTEASRMKPRGNSLLQGLAQQACPCHEVSPEVMKAMSLEETPPGILAVAKPKPASWRSSASGVAVLCGVRDPGNAGAILRTAEAAGYPVWFSEDSVAPWHPKTVKSAMGSFFRLPFVRGNLLAQLNSWKNEGRRIVGTSMTKGTRYWEWNWKAPFALLLGGEASGLPKNVEGYLTDKVMIPMEKPVESLNVASAAAVLLFEARRPANFSHG